MIAVMGATGNTGRKIALGLLENGEHVRAMGRSRERLAPLADAGAEVMVGDTSDPDFLAEAFRGAEAVYTLLPTNRRADDYPGEMAREGEAIVHAIRENATQYVVALSSIGSELSSGTGVIAGLHDQEQRLRALNGANVLLLRAVSFFENLYDTLELIRYQGIIADAVEPDLQIPMVATRDIADAAIVALKRRDWTGVQVREVIGPRDISYREATRIIGDRIGKPELAYVQLSRAELMTALVDAGMSESFADRYGEMVQSFNDGVVQPLRGRTADNTTPTTFETFVDEFAQVYFDG